MIVTEEEAKTKWCPMARVYVVSKDGKNDMGPLNRAIYPHRAEIAHNPADARCIGSQCMFWRVAEKSFERELTDSAARQAMAAWFHHKSHRIVKRAGYDWIIMPDRGYCGAGGKP